jgi:hypothetical protein
VSFNRKQVDRKKSKQYNSEPRVKSVNKSTKAVRKNYKQYISTDILDDYEGF